MAAAALAVAGAIGACGSSSSPSSTSSGSGGRPTPARLQQDAVRFAGCMRSHGVPGWPDPGSDGHFDKSKLVQLGVSRSRVHAASMACGRLLPGGGPSDQSTAPGPTHIAALLAFARCLRSHGFPSFPDPTSSGQVTREMLANAGIDLHQPAVVQAADACVGVTRGVITRAAVARFVAGR